jgi:hypothetical protein
MGSLVGSTSYLAKNIIDTFGHFLGPVKQADFPRKNPGRVLSISHDECRRAKPVDTHASS